MAEDSGTAVAAPVAPAPVAPVAPAAPAGPQESAIDFATRQARANVEAGKSLLADTEPAKVSRDEGGRFTDQPRKEVGAGAVTGDESADSAPEAGQDAAGHDEGSEVGAEPVEGDKAADGQLEAEDPFVVEIPGRRPEDDPLQYKFETQEEVDHFRHLVNGFRRTEQLRAERAEVMEARTQQREFIEQLQYDPASVVREALADDIETQEYMALSLITDPRVWARIASKVEEFVNDPRELAAEGHRVRADIAERKNHFQEQQQFNRVVDRNVSEVKNTVQSLIPENLSDEAARLLYSDSIGDIKRYAEQQGLDIIPVEHIPAILAKRLAAHGLNPVDSRTSTGKPAGGSQSPAPVARPSAKTLPEKPAPKTGAQFRKASQVRRAAAATPAGAGSPGNAITPPPNQSVEERLKWHREQNAKGRKLSA
ncbi:MAG: hypothetical protein H0W63_03910 [Gemmatimonadaceae bacterium]|nr:hypothetical protein [Gemmatimonadaceae bacterium]